MLKMVSYMIHKKSNLIVTLNIKATKGVKYLVPQVWLSDPLNKTYKITQITRLVFPVSLLTLMHCGTAWWYSLTWYVVSLCYNLCYCIIPIVRGFLELLKWRWWYPGYYWVLLGFNAMIWWYDSSLLWNWCLWWQSLCAVSTVNGSKT